MDTLGAAGEEIRTAYLTIRYPNFFSSINGIEGFWGYLKEHLLKHHGVATYNLIYYVKELEFRFNNRDLSTGEMVYKIVKALMNFTPSDD